MKIINLLIGFHQLQISERIFLFSDQTETNLWHSKETFQLQQQGIVSLVDDACFVHAYLHMLSGVVDVDAPSDIVVTA